MYGSKDPRNFGTHLWHFRLKFLYNCDHNLVCALMCLCWKDDTSSMLALVSHFQLRHWDPNWRPLLQECPPIDQGYQPRPLCLFKLHCKCHVIVFLLDVYLSEVKWHVIEAYTLNGGTWVSSTRPGIPASASFRFISHCNSTSPNSIWCINVRWKM